MSEGCENLEKCGFFAKYKETKDLACKGFIKMYCQGPHMNECKRKEYKHLHNAPPSDNMMPNGGIIPDGA